MDLFKFQQKSWVFFFHYCRMHSLCVLSASISKLKAIFINSTCNPNTRDSCGRFIGSLKQTSLASVGKRAGENCLARGNPHGSGVPAGSTTSLLSHWQHRWKPPEDKAWMCIPSHLEGDSTQSYSWATWLPGSKTPGAWGHQDAVLLKRADWAIWRQREHNTQWNVRKERPPCWLSLAVADSFNLFWINPVYSKNSDTQHVLAE